MRLVNYQIGQARGRLGAVVGDVIVDLARIAEVAGRVLPDNMLAFIQGGKEMQALAHELLCKYEGNWAAGVTVPVASAKLLAPFRPNKIIGIGLNYVEHVEESSRTLDTSKELPTRPVLFAKASTAVIGPDDAIHHNASLTNQVDWESELAVVMGRDTKGVSEAEALQYVFGYSIMNDISARDQRRSGLWFFSKGQDTYAPFGPYVVTADEVPDPHTLGIKLRVNGVTKQDSNTKYMLFKVPALIADITSGVTLEAGDVIATGTPSGVGAGRVPQEFLQPGDVVEAEVEGLGILRNHVVAV